MDLQSDRSDIKLYIYIIKAPIEHFFVNTCTVVIGVQEKTSLKYQHVNYQQQQRRGGNKWKYYRQKEEEKKLYDVIIGLCRVFIRKYA